MSEDWRRSLSWCSFVGNGGLPIAAEVMLPVAAVLMPVVAVLMELVAAAAFDPSPVSMSTWDVALVTAVLLPVFHNRRVLSGVKRQNGSSSNAIPSSLVLERDNKKRDEQPNQRVVYTSGDPVGSGPKKCVFFEDILIP